MSEEILGFTEKDLDSLCALQEYKIYWVICSCSSLKMKHFILLILLILIILIISIIIIVVIVIIIGVVMMIP